MRAYSTKREGADFWNVILMFEYDGVVQMVLWDRYSCPSRALQTARWFNAK